MSDNLMRRLREPPLGTETSERNLMAAAADEIAALEAANAKLREDLGVTRTERHGDDEYIGHLTAQLAAAKAE